MTETTNTLSLWTLESGQSCILEGFSQELDPRYLERVLELGFRPKTRVLCLKSPSFGAPKVYQIGNSVFSLDDSIASNIYVALQSGREGNK